MGCRGEERRAPNARYDVAGRGRVAGLCNVTVGLPVLFGDLIIGEISDWRKQENRNSLGCHPGNLQSHGVIHTRTEVRA